MGIRSAEQRAGVVPQATRVKVYAIQSIFTIIAILLVLLLSFQVSLPLPPEAERTDGGLLMYISDIVSLPGLMPYNAISVVAICVAVFLWLGAKDAVYLAGLTLFQGVVSTAIKIVYPIERPYVVDVNAPLQAINNSFPSGHVMLYVVFYGFLFYLAWTRVENRILRITVLSVSSIILLLGSFSRLYLGTHWVADVVAAQILGLAILFPGIEFYERCIVARE